MIPLNILKDSAPGAQVIMALMQLIVKGQGRVEGGHPWSHLQSITGLVLIMIPRLTES